MDEYSHSVINLLHLKITLPLWKISPKPPTEGVWILSGIAIQWMDEVIQLFRLSRLTTVVFGEDELSLDELLAAERYALA